MTISLTYTVYSPASVNVGISVDHLTLSVEYSNVPLVINALACSLYSGFKLVPSLIAISALLIVWASPSYVTSVPVTAILAHKAYNVYVSPSL